MLELTVHVRLVAVARHMAAAYPSLAILPARRTIRHRRAGDRAQRVQHIHFLAADVVGVVGHRRLHRHQAKQLEQMVLHHVAQGAGMFVVAAALLHAQRLRHRDGHMVHIAPVPDGFEDRVGKTHGQDVLHRLLAQEVIDAEYLLLAEEPGQHIVDRDERVEVMSQRFLHDDTHMLAVLCQTCRPQTTHHRLEQEWGDRQIEHLFGLAAPVGIASPQHLAQVNEAAGIADVGTDIPDQRGEFLPHLFRRGAAARMLRDALQIMLAPAYPHRCLPGPRPSGRTAQADRP